MSKIIAIANQKGGCGKSTTAVNLGIGLVRKGKKVLILDDVITSGSTLHSCLLLVLAQEPQSVELLALSTKNIGRIEVC